MVIVPVAQAALPDQPAKVDPGDEMGESTTCVPSGVKIVEQVPEEQLIPEGLLTTVPLPVPPILTERVAPLHVPDDTACKLLRLLEEQYGGPLLVKFNTQVMVLPP
jgi:hypothetical protein